MKSLAEATTLEKTLLTRLDLQTAHPLRDLDTLFRIICNVLQVEINRTSSCKWSVRYQLASRNCLSRQKLITAI
jgi:hypothetical protein